MNDMNKLKLTKTDEIKRVAAKMVSDMFESSANKASRASGIVIIGEPNYPIELLSEE